jgi:hypothetical protein
MRSVIGSKVQGYNKLNQSNNLVGSPASKPSYLKWIQFILKKYYILLTVNLYYFKLTFFIY